MDGTNEQQLYSGHLSRPNVSGCACISTFIPADAIPWACVLSQDSNNDPTASQAKSQYRGSSPQQSLKMKCKEATKPSEAHRCPSKNPITPLLTSLALCGAASVVRIRVNDLLHLDSQQIPQPNLRYIVHNVLVVVEVRIVDVRRSRFHLHIRLYMIISTSTTPPSLPWNPS